MEDGVSVDVDKFNARLSPSNRLGLGKNGRPVVEVFVRHAEAEGRKNLGLESHSSNISEPSVMQDDTAGEFDREEDDGEPSHNNGFYGNRHATKLLQVFQPITKFNIYLIAMEKMMGVQEHCVPLMPDRGQTTEMVRMTGWNLMEEARLLPLFDECPTPTIV